MKTQSSTKFLAFVFFGFWAFFFLMMSLGNPVNKILCSEKLSTWTLTESGYYYYEGPVYGVLCSDYEPSSTVKIKAGSDRWPHEEFTVNEQLSKFYLFMIILISGYAYQTFKKPVEINISICFLILGLTMYLSESNMISNNPQLFLAPVILLCTFYMLFKNKSFSTIFLVLLGFFIISGGILLDFTHQHAIIKSYVPAQYLSLMERFGEETFDVLGIAVVCFSVVFCFLEPIKKFTKNNIGGVLSLLISAGLITIGNGFSHFEYHPGRKLQLLAFVLSFSGWIGLMLTNKLFSKKDIQLYILNEKLYYAFIFILFVMLPTVYGVKNDDLISIILWAPILIFITVNLYRKHPLLLRKDAR